MRRSPPAVVAAAPAGFTCDAADFDGTNDFMTRGAGLTGAVDGKQGIFSAWVRLDGGDGTALTLFESVTLLGGNTPRLTVDRLSLNLFRVQARNSANTVILNLLTNNTYIASATWLHVLASWDLATAGARHLYINDVSDINVTIFTNDTIDYTVGDWGCGAVPNGTSKFNGCIAEVYFNDAAYLDLSVTANRRLFIDAAGKPVNLGTDGSTPTGSAPIVYFHLDVGEAVANFATNRGTGGNVTITGTLDTCSSSPST